VAPRGQKLPLGQGKHAACKGLLEVVTL
jgi:hypothetical protein